MPDPQLDRPEFRKRFLEPFADPAFELLAVELDRIAAAAWDGYIHHRKAPRTAKAGEGFADPSYDLAVDWVAARQAIDVARAEHDDNDQPPCILIISASSRSEHSCPGEMSKSWRLLKIAEEICGVDGTVVQTLDLSRLTSEYGRNIHPCKACFSTAAALCPLAVKLVSELCARPDAGLDERNLSALGARARHHDCYPGQLIIRRRRRSNS